MGPLGFADADVYLRTATAVDAQGWASYGMVRMPEYRWGIFLADAVPDRRIGLATRSASRCGSRCRRAPLGSAPADRDPGRHRAASVEQQRMLGRTCPSLYDLRKPLPGQCRGRRHLWAMAYLLHGYFGRDGREEADELLARHSGDLDKPRILGTSTSRSPIG